MARRRMGALGVQEWVQAATTFGPVAGALAIGERRAPIDVLVIAGSLGILGHHPGKDVVQNLVRELA